MAVLISEMRTFAQFLAISCNTAFSLKFEGRLHEHFNGRRKIYLPVFLSSVL